jgi:hypothetical protein
MFVLKSSNGKYYTGRAGSWDYVLDANKDIAFVMTLAQAKHKAEWFNTCTRLHGMVFTVHSALTIGELAT